MLVFHGKTPSDGSLRVIGASSAIFASRNMSFRLFQARHQRSSTSNSPTDDHTFDSEVVDRVPSQDRRHRRSGRLYRHSSSDGWESEMVCSNQAFDTLVAPDQLISAQRWADGPLESLPWLADRFGQGYTGAQLLFSRTNKRHRGQHFRRGQRRSRGRRVGAFQRLRLLRPGLRTVDKKFMPMPKSRSTRILSMTKCWLSAKVTMSWAFSTWRKNCASVTTLFAEGTDVPPR